MKTSPSGGASDVLMYRIASQTAFILSVSLLGASLLALSSSQTSAREPTYGVGLRVGSLSGITGQYRFSAANALNAGLSYDLLDPSIDVSLDQVLINTRSLFLGVFYPYFGWGGRLRLQDQFSGRKSRESGGVHIIAQAPLGLEIKCSRRGWCTRWRGFIELVPGVMVIPRVDVAINAALGVRCHF